MDYLAANQPPSPVQHYWTLSAEEQLYVLWPLFLLGLTLLSRRRPDRGATIRPFLIALAVVASASLGYSIYESAHNPAVAYFSTFTRAWEFAAGGLLATAGARLRAPDPIRAVGAWIGLAALAATAFAYSPQTQYPGAAALVPAIGTLLVIWSEAPTLRWAPPLAWRPAQFLGDVSYSTYLWHWPLLVLVPYAANHLLRGYVRVSLMVVSVGLGWLTKVVIEDPIRQRKPLSVAGRRRTLVVATAAVLVVAAFASSLVHARNVSASAEVKELASFLRRPPPCFGAETLDPKNKGCQNPDLRGRVIPTPAAVQAIRDIAGRHKEVARRCPRVGPINVCNFSAPGAGQSARTVALIGDSHAAHWIPAVGRIAYTRGWRAYVVFRPNCPYSAAVRALSEPSRSACVRWKTGVRQWLISHPDVDTVLFGQQYGSIVVAPAGANELRTRIKGYEDGWRALPSSVKRIVVIRDNPGMLPEDGTNHCVEKAIGDHDDPGPFCARPRSVALPPDPAVAAAQGMHSKRFSVIDLTRYFCDATTCPPVIGHALVYLDMNHISDYYVVTLVPYFERQLDRILRR